MAEKLEDMEAFLRVAKYTLIKYTDMHAEMREEAVDICITAVEKYPNDMEKCTQVRDAGMA
jgi:dynein light chain 4, axonemal